MDRQAKRVIVEIRGVSVNEEGGRVRGERSRHAASRAG